MNRTGPNPHRAKRQNKYTNFHMENQAFLKKMYTCMISKMDKNHSRTAYFALTTTSSVTTTGSVAQFEVQVT